MLHIWFIMFFSNIVQKCSVESDLVFVCVLWLPSITIKARPLSAIMSPCVDSTGCTYISCTEGSAGLAAVSTCLQQWISCEKPVSFPACFNVTQYQVAPSNNSLDNNTHYGSITMVMFALLHWLSPVWEMLLIYFYEIILQY